MGNHDIQISALNESDIRQTAALMVDVFSKEGITRYAHKESRSETVFCAAGELKLKLYLNTAQHVFIARQGQKIVGCFILTDGKISLLQKVRVYFPRVLPLLIPIIRSMKPKQAYRLSKLLKLSHPLQKPYLTLEIVGVDEAYQGRGIGKQLFRKMDALIEDQPHYTGVYLYTADKKNVDIYERLGYELIERNASDEITIYHMFKAKS